MKFYTHSLLISLLLLFVTACGGGGGGAPVQGEVGEATPNGIYTGTYTDDGTAYTDFVALVQGGRFVGLSTGNLKIHTGTGAVDGQSLSGTLNVYATNGGLLPQATLAATFVEGVSISGTITDADGIDTFSLTMDSIYNRPPNTTLEGVYSVEAGGITFTIDTYDTAGNFTGSDDDIPACTYDGSQDAFDTTHNFYRLTVTVDNCAGFNGTYTGYAFNDDFSALNDNDSLVWVIDDPTFILILSMLRQS